jgi:hypothetical protein
MGVHHTCIAQQIGQCYDDPGDLQRANRIPRHLTADERSRPLAG